MNSKELGERKNGNLPGVKVDIPVLTEKDIGDLQNFCAKHKMDYVAASFVQVGSQQRYFLPVCSLCSRAGGLAIVPHKLLACGAVLTDWWGAGVTSATACASD